jgi:hypothetical protein
MAAHPPGRAGSRWGRIGAGGGGAARAGGGAVQVDGEVDLNSTVEVEVELALVQATLDSTRLTAVRDAPSTTTTAVFVIFACLGPGTDAATA